MSGTITLAGHPQCGEKVSIIGPFGLDMVQVELPDGRVRLVPVRWTSLHPTEVSELGGKQVRFQIESLRVLANWIAARVHTRGTDCRKVGHFDKREEKVAPHDALRRGVQRTDTCGAQGRGRGGEGRGPAAAGAVVEQVGAPVSHGGRRRHRAQRKRRK